MIAEKKTWTTPQLTVLLRSRPEEAVLAGCKFGSNTNRAIRGALQEEGIARLLQGAGEVLAPLAFPLDPELAPCECCDRHGCYSGGQHRMSATGAIHWKSTKHDWQKPQLHRSGAQQDGRGGAGGLQE